MRHVDPDTLALLALGEMVADDADREHLDRCRLCRAELEEYTRTVSIGRTTLADGELVEPAPRVWERITDELGIASSADQPAPVVSMASRRRPWITVAAVAASVALVATAAVAVSQFVRPAGSTVIASAALDAFPGWPDATGQAVVEQQADGSRIVQVSVDADGAGSDEEYVEAWLISSDATQLVSLGTVDGTSGTFAIPAGVDLSVYDQVDVSAEPYDGDPAHSGDSILRGQLQ